MNRNNYEEIKSKYINEEKSLNSVISLIEDVVIKILEEKGLLNE